MLMMSFHCCPLMPINEAPDHVRAWLPCSQASTVPLLFLTALKGSLVKSTHPLSVTHESLWGPLSRHPADNVAPCLRPRHCDEEYLFVASACCVPFPQPSPSTPAQAKPRQPTIGRRKTEHPPKVSATHELTSDPTPRVHKSESLHVTTSSHALQAKAHLPSTRRCIPALGLHGWLNSTPRCTLDRRSCLRPSAIYS